MNDRASRDSPLARRLSLFLIGNSTTSARRKALLALYELHPDEVTDALVTAIDAEEACGMKHPHAGPHVHPDETLGQSPGTVTARGQTIRARVPREPGERHPGPPV